MPASSLKKKQARKEDWGCCSIVEYLPTMYKVLGSIPNTTKEIKRRKGRKEANLAGRRDACMGGWMEGGKEERKEMHLVSCCILVGSGSH
jgi:hypothetical protein